eukprot:1170201-Pleurochrysis_carterae.AAC.2
MSCALARAVGCAPPPLRALSCGRAPRDHLRGRQDRRSAARRRDVDDAARVQGLLAARRRRRRRPHARGCACRLPHGALHNAGAGADAFVRSLRCKCPHEHALGKRSRFCVCACSTHRAASFANCTRLNPRCLRKCSAGRPLWAI